MDGIIALNPLMSREELIMLLEASCGPFSHHLPICGYATWRSKRSLPAEADIFFGITKKRTVWLVKRRTPSDNYSHIPDYASTWGNLGKAILLAKRSQAKSPGTTLDSLFYSLGHYKTHKGLVSALSTPIKKCVFKEVFAFGYGRLPKLLKYNVVHFIGGKSDKWSEKCKVYIYHDQTKPICVTYI